jgi:hypothetical protein
MKKGDVKYMKMKNVNWLSSECHTSFNPIYTRGIVFGCEPPIFIA